MVNIVKQRKFKTFLIIFQDKKVYHLLKQFDRTLNPIFKITMGPYAETASPNNSFRKNTRLGYQKLLMKLKLF